MDGPTIPGTEEEARALLAAIENHCQCVYNEAQERTALCAAHTMLLSDKRAINGLLFERRRRECLEREEGIITTNGED